MGRTYAALLHEYLEEMEELTDEEFGRLCRGLLRYSAAGEAMEPLGNERFYIRHVMAQEDRHQASYELLRQERSEAGKKGAASRWGMAKDGKHSNTKTETQTKNKNNTNSPLLGGQLGERMLTDVEKLRQFALEAQP